MKSHTRVAVIGGGVVGASVLFHLARHGWTDVVLIERSELTSGSTWHAAGGMHTINGDPNVAKLQKYTIGLYKEIEELSGQATGVHVTGGVLLAATEARMDWLRGVVAKGRYLGLDLEEISAEEAARLMPLLDPKQFVGAVRNSEDGHLDPSGVTHAYAKAARQLGAEIYRHTKVEDLVQREDGRWRVITDKGEIVTEHVVNAGGLWAREIGRMVQQPLRLPRAEVHHRRQQQRLRPHAALDELRAQRLMRQAFMRRMLVHQHQRPVRDLVAAHDGTALQLGEALSELGRRQPVEHRLVDAGDDDHGVEAGAAQRGEPGGGGGGEDERRHGGKVPA